MSFTGDLEHLNVVDIIQLLNTTRKSGVFSVTGSTGESRIVFSNGDIVDANHLDNRVHIGAVLLKMNAITVDDLQQAFRVMKDAGENRRPVLVTLIQMGRLKREDALRGLKKLIEITIVDLMSWTKGAFTIDTDAIGASHEKEHDSGGPEEGLKLDAQMVLMDALRIVDERERDRQKGKEVPTFEEFTIDLPLDDGAMETGGKQSVVTADDLGLADIDHLERKIPRPVSEMEIFDPLEIHRRKIKEILEGFSSEEQEAFVSFLGRSLARKTASDAVSKQAGKAIVIFSEDKLIRHSVMTICKDDGVLVFATDDEKDMERIITQCISIGRRPIVVFDSPMKSEGGIPEENIIRLRNQVRGMYAAVPVFQFAAPTDGNFALRAYTEGVSTVFPKPQIAAGRETFIQDTIRFLETFKSYIKSFRLGLDDADSAVRKLKEGILSFRSVATPSDVALTILTAVSEFFERVVTLVVRSSGLIGERAIGVSAEKSMGPTPADRLKVSLAEPSVFRDVLEKRQVYYGESDDDVLRKFFNEIGKPLSPAIVLLPLISDHKVVAMIYGDFGEKEPSTVLLDILEIFAAQAGIAMENALFRRQMTKAAQ